MKQSNLSRSPSLALAPGEDGYHAFDLESRELHWFNPAAALIIELCDGAHNQADICTILAQLQEGAQDGAEANCKLWIKEALERGWVKYAGDESPEGNPAAQTVADLVWDLREEGEFLAAYVCQEYAVELQPESETHWRYLGETAHIIGRRARALEAYEEYLTFKPEDAEVLQMVVALRDEPPPSRAPDEYIEQLYKRFSEYYEESMCDELGYRGPERVGELLDQFLGDASDLDVLDIGCGTGLSGKPLKPRAASLMGIDLSAEMLNKAEATGLYNELEHAELTKWLANRESSFDLIVACDTCIYFGDLSQVISPASQILRPGGWLLISVEKGDDHPFCLTDSGRYTHTQKHIEESANEVGLEVLGVDEDFLRSEYTKPVIGLMVLMQKPS